MQNFINVYAILQLFEVRLKKKEEETNDSLPPTSFLFSFSFCWFWLFESGKKNAWNPVNFQNWHKTVFENNINMKRFA